MQGKRRGLIQVYTGDGKGKTTAAVGLAVRAIGRGMHVHMIQFIKSRTTGEKMAARNMLKSMMVIEQFGTGWFVVGEPEAADIEAANAGLARACEVMMGGSADLLILDEISHAVNKGLIPVSRVLEMVARKPEQLELVLTGRDMPEDLVEVADLVTEMVKVKHPYDEGIKSRPGIEY